MNNLEAINFAVTLVVVAGICFGAMLMWQVGTKQGRMIALTFLLIAFGMAINSSSERFIGSEYLETLLRSGGRLIQGGGVFRFLWFMTRPGNGRKVE